MAEGSKWEAKINLKSGGAPVSVQVTAFNYAEAVRMIEAMYGSGMKSWFLHPREIK